MNKKNIFLLFILFGFIKIYSQEQIIPPKRIFKDKTGKIYVNRKLPLYFKISETPNKNSEHKLLRSEDPTEKEFTNPLYLGKEGLNLFYSKWAIDTITKKYVLPKRNVYFEVYGDSKPPKTKIHNNIVSYKRKDTLFFGKGLKIWFNANDDVSGVDKIYISINGAKFTEYPNDTISFSQQGFYTIKYYATDRVGNYEKIKQVSFMVDTTKPYTNLIINGPHINNIVSAKCKVFLKSQDAFCKNAKTYYYIDNHPKNIYTQPISVARLTEGRHILHYFSKDNVNNIENQKTYEFYLDKTPPMVMSEVIGDYIMVNGKNYTSGSSQVQLNAIDNKAGVKAIYYSLDGKKWEKYTKPFDLPQKNTSVKVLFYAEDMVGNIGKTNINSSSNNQNYFSSQMDLIPPKIKYNFVGKKINLFDTTFISPNTKIYVSATDNQSGLAELNYQIDESSPYKYQKYIQIQKTGWHKISLMAMDKVNNMQTKDFSVYVDNKGPKIKITYSTKARMLNNSKVYPQGTIIFFAATDQKTNLETLYYSLNNSGKKIHSSSIKLVKTGTYQIKIYAQDVLGNQTVEKISVKIK
jgi:hypothetical protein